MVQAYYTGLNRQNGVPWPHHQYHKEVKPMQNEPRHNVEDPPKPKPAKPSTYITKEKITPSPLSALNFVRNPLKSHQEDDIFMFGKEDVAKDIFSIEDDALILEEVNATSKEPTKRIVNTPSCGVGGSGDRIIGGSPVPAGLYPWVTSLQLGWDYHYCGGALIKPDYILTAAHCVSWGRGVLHTNIKLGGNHNRVTRRVKKVKIHAGYDDLTNDNDIALIKLSAPVEMGGSIGTICLPEEGQAWGERQAVVAGWGHTR